MILEDTDRDHSRYRCISCYLLLLCRYIGWLADVDGESLLHRRISFIFKVVMRCTDQLGIKLFFFSLIDIDIHLTNVGYHRQFSAAYVGHLEIFLTSIIFHIRTSSRYFNRHIRCMAIDKTNFNCKIRLLQRSGLITLNILLYCYLYIAFGMSLLNWKPTLISPQSYPGYMRQWRIKIVYVHLNVHLIPATVHNIRNSILRFMSEYFTPTDCFYLQSTDFPTNALVVWDLWLFGSLAKLNCRRFDCADYYAVTIIIYDKGQGCTLPFFLKLSSGTNLYMAVFGLFCKTISLWFWCMWIGCALKSPKLVSLIKMQAVPHCFESLPMIG